MLQADERKDLYVGSLGVTGGLLHCVVWRISSVVRGEELVSVNVGVVLYLLFVHAGNQILLSQETGAAPLKVCILLYFQTNTKFVWVETHFRSQQI